MKKFVITIILIVALMTWLGDWISSGKMDNFIRLHKHPKYTEQVIYFISQFYTISQSQESAIHYFRWMIDEYPNNENIAKIHYQLGKCYEETSRRNLAKEQYTILRDSFSATEYGRLGMNRYSQIGY